MDQDFDHLAHADRFWANVNKDGPTVAHLDTNCWDWTKALTPYGSFRGRPAHRTALEMSIGRRLRPGMFACHRCDRPSCIRPEHLYEGTPKQNSADAKERARGVGRPKKRPEDRVSSIVGSRISSAAAERVEAIAAQRGIRPSDCVREAITEWLSRQ